MFLGIAIMVAAGICILGVTTCQDRWLQPILIASPLLLVLIFHEQLSAGRLKALLIVSGVITLFVAIAAPGRILLTEALHKKEILNSPFRQLAADLKAPLAHAEAIHAENRWLAGNLRLWFPGKRITSPDTVRLYAPDTNCALIWDATGAEKSFPALLAVQPSGPVLDAAFHYEKQLKFHRTNTMRLGLILPGAGRP